MVSARLAELADPERAVGMAAYMKTDQLFYGVTAPERRSILRRMVAEFVPSDASDYRRAVLALWALPHREEQYLAIGYARRFESFVNHDQLDLYRGLVVEGGWWDFVDEIASHLVGRVLLAQRAATSDDMRAWIEDDDMWLRRAAILSQLRHKENTDSVMLFDFCRRRAHDSEFFIRKAIGWALREQAKTDPEGVRSFRDEMGGDLSGLSRREASKHL